MNIYIQLFISFCKIGALMFGGGYAMLPILEHEIVDKKQWFTNEEILDLYALAQCTPGVIAVNTATKVGYKIKGIIGAIISTIGVILPSFLIIIGISVFLKSFSYISYIQNILSGIRIAACAMMVNTLIKLMKAGIKDKIGLIIFFIAAILAIILKVQSVWLVCLAICSGIICGNIKRSKNND